jgi:phenylalanyl-tRNA synthetase beta chain
VKVSLEWVRDYVELPPEVDAADLAHELTLKTVEVENVDKVEGDVIFEIDNKSLTNRPDLWCHYGIARELATIYGLPLKPLPTAPRPPTAEGLIGTVDATLCQRFAAVEFAVDATPATPAHIRRRLERIGEASVGLCVDLSNYVMFTVGQPTHVYDADHAKLPLSAETLDVDETLEPLTGQRVPLTGPTGLVHGEGQILAIAGVIGGLSCAVTPTSRRFVLEAATFRPRPIRAASQRLGLRTEASARFEKGLDTQRVDAAIDLFLHLLGQAAPQASVTSMQDVTLEPTVAAPIVVDRDFLDRRIGQRLDDAEIQATLGGLGFATIVDPSTVRTTAPTARSTGDVSLPHDVVEEVARIHGYDRLPIARTSVALVSARSLNRRPLSRVVREQLATRAGLQEVVTYPWTADALLAAVGFSKDDTARFQGAPAPDRDSLRPSLIPNLLEAVAGNLRYSTSFGIFEVGTVFAGGVRVPYNGVHEPMPPMGTRLALALVDADGAEAFRRAKGVLDMLRRHCHLTGLVLAGDSDLAWADRSARLALHAADIQVGTLALLTPKTRRLAGIDTVQVACAELDLAGLSRHPSRENRFEPLPELPEGDFDLSVVVADDTKWSAIEATTRRAHDLVTAVAYIEEYRGTWVPDGYRSLTLRITLRPKDATLTSDVIGTVRGDVLDLLGRDLQASQR